MNIGFQLTSISPRTIKLVLIGMGIAMAGLLGRVVPSWGIQVLAGLLAPVGALLVLSQPVLGMYFLAAAIPLEGVSALGGGLTIIRLGGIFLFGAWLIPKLLRRESWRPLVSTGLFKAALLFAFFALTSMLWAMSTSKTSEFLFQLLRLILWSLLIADLANSWERMAWLAKMLVIGAQITATLTIHQFLTTGMRAGAGIGGGINATAYLMVAVVPFAFYLLQAKENRFWSLVGLLYLGTACGAVAVTFSRTSYIMLSLVVLAQYWETIKTGVGRGKLILLAGVAVVALVVLMPRDLVTERVQSIASYVRLGIQGKENEEGVLPSRGFILHVGLAIFRDHPLIGVGYGNFGDAYLIYQHRVPYTYSGYTNKANRSPHNSYLGLLTEVGLIGLLLFWGLMAGIVLRNLIISWSLLNKALDKTKPSKQLLFVQALTYCFLLQFGYALARNIQEEKLFWLLLGLSITVRNLVEQSRQSPVSNDNSSPVKQLSPSATRL